MISCVAFACVTFAAMVEMVSELARSSTLTGISRQKLEGVGRGTQFLLTPPSQLHHAILTNYQNNEHWPHTSQRVVGTTMMVQWPTA